MVDHECDDQMTHSEYLEKQQPIIELPRREIGVLIATPEDD